MVSSRGETKREKYTGRCLRTYLSHEEEISLLHRAVGLQEVRLEVHIEKVTGDTIWAKRSQNDTGTQRHQAIKNGNDDEEGGRSV